MKKKLSTADFIRKRAKGSPEEGEEKDSALPEGMRKQRKEQEDARRLLDMLVMSGALPDPSLGPLSLDLVSKGKKLEESEGRVGLDVNGVMPFVDVSRQGDVSEYGVKYGGGDPSRAYELMLSQRVPMKVPGGEIEMPIVGQGSYSMPFAGGSLSAQGYVVPRQGDMPKSQYGANLMFMKRFSEGGEAEASTEDVEDSLQNKINLYRNGLISLEELTKNMRGMDPYDVARLFGGTDDNPLYKPKSGDISTLPFTPLDLPKEDDEDLEDPFLDLDKLAKRESRASEEIGAFPKVPFVNRLEVPSYPYSNLLRNPERKLAKGGEVSTTDFIRKRENGSPPEGEVPTEDYIQQMFTGTPPADRTTNPGFLPPELRQAVDVPLDLANTFIRSAAGSIAGPAYGVYKGVTSDKFGTPEGVQEASSEAGRMMQKISGTPKTQTGRDVMEFIGEKAEALKLAPTPQLLTAPLPGPGSASALLRNYELAETPPMGAINVPGTKAQVTPPKNEMGFFSPTEQVVMNLPQEKGTAQQMLAQISKAPGAKAAELRATGLEEFLKSKGTAPVTRQEIQDYLASNRVQVDEIVLGKGQTLSPEAKRLSDEALGRMESIDDKLANYFEGVESVAGQDPYSLFVRLRGPVGRKAAKGDQEALDELNALNLPPEIRDLVLEFGRNKNEYVKYTGQARKMEKPKFDRYNTPGGTNAREIYLTLPLREPAIPEGYGISSVQYDDGSVRYFANTPTTRSAGYRTEQEAMSRLQEQIVGLRDFREDVKVLFRVPDIHSVSPEADRNRLAHIFLDDRTDAEGKKVLFVQELQSDWAQQGRDKGFAKTYTPDQLKAEEVLPKPPGPRVWTVTYPDGNQSTFAGNTADEAIAFAVQRQGNIGAPPPAPFVTTTDDWVNLALKRVIKDAVDNGYDKVAFIKGEQAAKKYSLSTVLDGIEVGPSQLQSSTFLSPNSPRLVELKQKGGGIIPLFVNQKGVVETVDNDSYRQQFRGKPLSEIVGKEMSEKIMTATLKPGGESSVNFDVKDMEVGGEGMKGFYDNILPKTANKLLAKLGSKIEPVGVVEAVPSQMPFQAYAARGDSFLDWMQQNHPEVSQADAVRAWGMGVDNNQFVKDFYESTKADQYLGFKITPEMIDMVKTQGLPQFAAGGEVTKFIKAHA